MEFDEGVREGIIFKDELNGLEVGVCYLFFQGDLFWDFLVVWLVYDLE